MRDDFDFEPVPGLPSHLPVGERMLWQGAPRWRDLAVRAYHVDKLAAYVVALVTVRLLIAVRGGQHLDAALASYGLYLLAALAALGILTGLAYLMARGTLYTLTTERLVIRTGAALPLTVNIPLSRIAQADLALRDDGTGDISLTPTAGDRLAWFALWPHVRGWHIDHPRAALRCIPAAKVVAGLLGDALATSTAAADAKRVHHAATGDADASEVLNHLQAAE